MLRDVDEHDDHDNPGVQPDAPGPTRAILFALVIG
jgi:hypothetical protein